MTPQTKTTATIIWFAIFSGLFIILQFAGGGFERLSGEIGVKSAPLMLVGLMPLVVGVIGRMMVIPKAKSDEAFMSRLVLCLALCEAPAIMGIFAFPKDYTLETTVAFIGSVLGMLPLFPATIRMT